MYTFLHSLVHLLKTLSLSSRLTIALGPQRASKRNIRHAPCLRSFVLDKAIKSPDIFVLTMWEQELDCVTKTIGALEV